MLVFGFPIGHASDGWRQYGSKELEICWVKDLIEHGRYSGAVCIGLEELPK